MTNGEAGQRRLPGYVIGSIIATGFGTGFIAGNSGGLPDPWPQILRVGAALCAAALIIATFRTRSASTAAPASGPAPAAEPVPARQAMGRGYWIVVAIEAIALFGGLFVINGVLHRSEVSVAWVALVVGLHFYGLGAVWHAPMYHWLATAMTALAVAGFVIYAAGGSAAAVSAVAGVGSGVCLYGAVLWGLLRARRGLTV
ncbi:hypothetical protein [Dactylosporangium matsuzakiense]|uniref:Uncharacterized protein n=1 Tax=Dactylosporangium matsuzakiense TaxID=53360 RepID=A0A9W6KP00_9ACTN|nr:hypothetical protein [Dactylosporangium matsuzakiense]UWZ41895.1 hypothetical protein Dmats_30255 [Dactylosporangium matsuzakiense]GLL04440.1 hypothetical protein GCM10017581_061870 [Dactylosporangium matsuzakiense]